MAPSRNRRPGFSRRAQYGLFLGYVIAVAGAIVAVVLLVFATLNPPAFAPLRAAVAEVTTPISSGFAGLGRGIASIPTGIGNHFTVMQKNAALRKELEANRALLLRARTLSYDNHRLKTLLHLRERVADPVVAARLVSSSGSSTRRYAVLNAGSWQGVRIGQPVRGPEGLVGRILETGPNTARVLLITDPESIVPVRRTRDGLPALAAGRGDGMIDVRSVSVSNVAFEPGDVFVTSGTGGIYSPNVPVARIVRRSRDTALARSFAQPDTLDFALVQQGFMPIQQPTPRHHDRPRAMRAPARNPFDPTPAPMLQRIIPAASVMIASLITLWPYVASFPLLPPLGLLVLLGWRLMRPDAFAIWAALPLGLFDDLVSGQPLGSAMLLWMICFFVIDTIDQRLVFRDFWQNWLIAAGATGFCLIAGRLIAAPIGAHVDTVLLMQAIISIMLFPLVARFCAWLDGKREGA